MSTSSTLVRNLVERFNWLPFRTPPSVADYELSGAAQVWLHNVPQHSRPLLLSRRFPRIANRMAELWGDSKALDSYLESLLLDDREGSRQGFPHGIRDEIATVRTYAARERARAVQRERAGQ